MADVLFSFDTPVQYESERFHARAVGKQEDDGMWIGWLEFVPLDGSSETLVTAVESTQPKRQHLAYWATGLSPVYLEGAFRRARNPVSVRLKPVEIAASDSPAARAVIHAAPSSTPEAVLDPFEIGRRSLDVLRQELTALNRPRLRNIIAAYTLNPDAEDLSWMSDAQLVHFIVVAVDTHLLQRAR